MKRLITRSRQQRAEALRLDVAIVACLLGWQADLKELGYGG